jgi:nitrogen fixation NifU-like protein
LNLSGEELSAPLGPLPPLKIHCAQLVEGALRSALAPETVSDESGGTGPSLLQQFQNSASNKQKVVWKGPND